MTLVFSYNVCVEYLQDNPITITTLLNQPEKPESFYVRICNNVYLDPAKILKYNGTSFSYASYEFLYEAVSGNTGFDDSAWVYKHPMRDYFLIPTRVFDEFRLNIEDFMLNCQIVNSKESCIHKFKWYLDPYMPCYLAKLDVKGFGLYQYLRIDLNFDPEVTLGKYTTKLGAFVVFYHPDEYKSLIDGFYLGPNEAAVVTATGPHEKQEKSIGKSKCVHRNGLEWHHFTGEPFQTSYNPDSCVDFCYAAGMHKLCQCSPFIGWNITNTDCIQAAEKRECFFRQNQNHMLFRSAVEACVLECHKKCEKKSLDGKVFKSQNSLASVQSLLSHMGKTSGNAKILEISKKFVNDANSIETASMLQNFAQLTFYFAEKEQWKSVETIPMMTFSTFLSNIGGLMGMWLGVSAITLMEWAEKVMKFCRKYPKNEPVLKVEPK